MMRTTLILLAHVLAAAVLLGRGLVSRFATITDLVLVPITGGDRSRHRPRAHPRSARRVADALPRRDGGPRLVYFLASLALVLLAQRMLRGKASGLGTLLGVGSFMALKRSAR